MPSILSRLAGRAGFARAHPPTPMLTAKSSRTAALFGFNLPGLTRFQPRTSPELTRHGYERNPIVFRSVRMIAEAVASVPWLVYEQGMETPDHPLLALLANPNAGQSGTALLEALVSNLLLFGNAYVEAVFLDGTLRELHALRPDRMSIVPGSNGWLAAFEYRAGAEKVRFDAGAGVSPILHLKFFAPLDDYYGHAPLAAAETALDIHNSASCWNRALLDNAARPSGALVYSGPEGATLSEEQFDRLKNELDESFSGARNAGRPLLLEGGLDWKALSLSPKDMDFIEAKAAAAREIALAFGVPPMVLGLPGDNTFSNYQEANRAFWRQTIVPFVSRLQKSFESWMQADFGTFELRANLDGVDALSSERASEWARIGAASFLTDDEKREAVGYAPRGAKGTLPDGSFDGSPVDAGVGAGGGGFDPGGNGGAWESQPRDDIGRWTSEGGSDQGAVQQAEPNIGKSALLTKDDGTPYTNPFVKGDNRIFYPSNLGPDYFISKCTARSDEPTDLTLAGC
jgi:HK97 family phage portal protein